MKTCKDCKITKPLTEFHSNGKSMTTGKIWYRGRCRKCHNLKFSPPNGRKPGVEKGNIPWNLKIKDGRRSVRAEEWAKKVIERDNYVCQTCSSTYKLCAHHVKTWKDYPELRFDLNNGITLCHSCHSKLHRSLDGFPNGRVPWNKGSIGVMKSWMKGKHHTDETKKKISDTKKGRKLSIKHRVNIGIGNKGKKLSEETKLKISKARKGYKPSIEHRRKISETLKGNIPWNFGKKMSVEHCKKLSKAQKKHNTQQGQKKLEGQLMNGEGL